MTAAEFFDWVHRPENRNRFFELEDGEVVEMPPPGKYHGFVCGNVAGILRNFGIQRGRGYVCTNDSGLQVAQDPDTVRGPDVTFYEDDQTAADMDRQYAAAPPRLAVEVLSPTARHGRTVRRVMQMLRFGVSLVWVIDPEGRDVSVYRAGRDPQVVTEQDELSGEDVLPGFSCRVAEFFATPGGVTASG
jgi:Uma2 family endonuclease